MSNEVEFLILNSLGREVWRVPAVNPGQAIARYGAHVGISSSVLIIRGHQAVIAPEEQEAAKGRQHEAPCSDCAFVRGCEVGKLGNSPPSVYVAQHFLPMKVPCHERYPEDTDFSDEDSWKNQVLGGHNCVGFAQCRNGRNVDQVMPSEMYTSKYDPKSGSFEDIWEFWAHHKQCSRAQALHDLTPQAIMHMCQTEWNRPGVRQLTAQPESMPRLVAIVSKMVLDTWVAAIKDHLYQQITKEKHEANETPAGD